jgi:predicted anti-sigma-YlaC factor YlaD
MNPICDSARRRIALGLEESAEPHLRRCDSCRLEAARVAELVRELAGSAVVDPPAALDGRVRDRLARAPFGSRPLPSLLTASGLALAAYAAVVFGIGIELAASGLAEAAPPLVAVLAVAYLAACTALSLPLLLKRARRRPIELQEVRS